MISLIVSIFMIIYLIFDNYRSCKYYDKLENELIRLMKIAERGETMCESLSRAYDLNNKYFDELKEKYNQELNFEEINKLKKNKKISSKK